ncbi:MAG: hypothetical protein J5719_02210 [Bacteroidales bacterium]|nr:hypothetical protein [Bacteroidales bacterium]
MKCKWMAVVALALPLSLWGQDSHGFRKIFDNEMSEEYGRALFPHNMATLAFREGGALSLCFENGYLLKELMDKSALFYLCRKGNLVSAQLSHSGFSKMGELTASCGYGRRFGSRFVAALRLFYIYSYARHYQPIHSFTVDISFAACVTDKLLLSVSTYNPIRMKYGITGSEYIPVKIHLDAAYALSKRVLLSLELQKNFPGPFQVAASCWLTLSKYIALAFSCALPQPSLRLSCILHWRHFSLEVASAYHFPLGLSPQCRLSYGF